MPYDTAAMGPLSLLLAVTLSAADTVPPYLSFPEPGLDDPAAYEGYTTRVYRDAAGNAFQVYLKGSTGRVVNLWADAADESVGFTARDSGGRPADLSWGSAGAVVTRGGPRRTVSYGLDAPASVTIGLILLGSMRVERDLQYAGRDGAALDAPSFEQRELTELIDHIARLKGPERARHLALLGASGVDALRARLEPRLSLERNDTSWVVRVEQSRFDAKAHLWLVLEGDSRETRPAVTGRTVVIRRPAGGPVHITVRVSTDAAALTPLSRTEIFNDDFRRFAERVRADTAHPARYRRLEREVRGFELLCYRQKVMAGLPNFATYFGRDMLMAALLMRPVWSPEMAEHVIASALGRLVPDGDVSHEEALGGQAIREHAAQYNRLMAAGQLARARGELADLAATRENHSMVDDDVQLPLVAAAYLVDSRVPPDRKRQFLHGEGRLTRLVANLALVARRAEPYARAPIPTNLVSFPRAPNGSWRSASWRDSRVGYAGGRFAMDVNVIWMPRALASIGVILDALQSLGLKPVVPKTEPLARYLRDRRALELAVAAWRGAERHFQIKLAPAEVNRRIAARLAWLPAPEREFWEGRLQRLGSPTDTLRFLALSLDGNGRPIPIVNTDPAMLLIVDSLAPGRVHELIDPILAAYPVGLFVDGLGPLTANDAYATRPVWEAFRADRYHSPMVVWGRDVNILLAGLAKATRNAEVGTRNGRAVIDSAFRVPRSALADAITRILTAVDRSGLRHAELWSYRIDNGTLAPIRYGSSSDVQLWSLTDLAVQYLLNTETP